MTNNIDNDSANDNNNQALPRAPRQPGGTLAVVGRGLGGAGRVAYAQSPY